MEDNFGGTSVEAVDAEILKEVVRRLTEGGKSLSPDQIARLAELTSQGITAKKASGDYSSMLEDMENVPKFGNDIEEADDLARLSALVYCREVEKYRNVRGGQFQPGLYPVTYDCIKRYIIQSEIPSFCS
jgi:formate C-acetyltransferase